MRNTETKPPRTPPHEAHFWRRLAYLGATRGPAWWVRHSPPAFGWAAAALLPSARRSVLRNLRQIRGQASPFADARDVLATFSAYASCLTEVLASDAPGGGPALETRHQNVHHLVEARAHRRGMIMVTAHTGGWETVGSLVAKAEGLRMMFVMRPEASRGARALQDDVRKRAGVTVLHVGDDPLACLPLLTHLRGGGVVALQLDRVAPGMRTLDVVRFGRKATIPEGPVRLAQLSGAPILPVFCAREGHRRYLVEFCASRLVARRSTDSDVAEVAQHLADSLGAFLCAHPTQWFHFEH